MQLVSSLFSLPARFGGPGIPRPTDNGAMYNNALLEIMRPAVELILAQSDKNVADYLDKLLVEPLAVIADIRKVLREAQNGRQVEICNKLPPSMQLPVQLAKEIGPSSWLTACMNTDLRTVDGRSIR